jgi:hypothetical protein
LKSTLNTTLRAWELAIFGVAILNVAGGAVSGLAGVLSKSWVRGLVIGAVLHAVIFGGWILLSDSLQAAPITVRTWFLVVGIMAGSLAGLVGGVLGRNRQ